MKFEARTRHGCHLGFLVAYPQEKFQVLNTLRYDFRKENRKCDCSILVVDCSIRVF